MTRALLLALLLLPGCPWCDADVDLDVVRGETTLRAGDRVYLELSSEGYTAGPDHCRGHWYVDGIEGGSQEVGIITRCGVYFATDWPHEKREVTVEATQYPIDGCADCCPYNFRKLTLLATYPRAATMNFK